MSTLSPAQCAFEGKERDLVVVLGEDQIGRCYDRAELIQALRRGEDTLTDHVFDISALYLVENFPFTVFQEFREKKRSHLGYYYLRPLPVSLLQYVNNEVDVSNFAEEKDPRVSVKTLGKGSFGVAMAYGDSPIVVKISKKGVNEDPGMIRELVLAVHLRSAPCCLVKTFDVTLGSSNVRIAMPKYRGDLVNEVDAGDFVQDPVPILYELVKGMYHAHARGVVHRDLKFDNVLMGNDGKPVLNDWGLSDFYPYGQETDDPVKGTLLFMAPELLLQRQYDYSLDIFALGLMGLGLTRARAYPLEDHQEPSWMKNQIEDEYPGRFHEKLADTLSYLFSFAEASPNLVSAVMQENPFPLMLVRTRTRYQYTELIARMTSADPRVRPTYDQILNHPVFDSVRGEEVFPEITLGDVIQELPSFQNTTTRYTLEAKLKAFQWIVKYVRDLDLEIANPYFLSFAIFNHISGRKNFRSAQMCAQVSVALALMLMSYPKMVYEDLVNQEFFTVLDEVEAVIKEDLYRAFPLMWIVKTDHEILMDFFLLYELSPTQVYTSGEVATTYCEVYQQDSLARVEVLPSVREEIMRMIDETRTTLGEEKLNSLFDPLSQLKYNDPFFYPKYSDNYLKYFHINLLDAFLRRGGAREVVSPEVDVIGDLEELLAYIEREGVTPENTFSLVTVLRRMLLDPDQASDERVSRVIERYFFTSE
jgi:serine/threonine protein kinase